MAVGIVEAVIEAGEQPRHGDEAVVRILARTLRPD
jgi:hypothetical protein